jgi:hypothetical protein
MPPVVRLRGSGDCIVLRHVSIPWVRPMRRRVNCFPFPIIYIGGIDELLVRLWEYTVWQLNGYSGGRIWCNRLFIVGSVHHFGDS